jgi:hypothetical protein
MRDFALQEEAFRQAGLRSGDSLKLYIDIQRMAPDGQGAAYAFLRGDDLRKVRIYRKVDIETDVKATQTANRLVYLLSAIASRDTRADQARTTLCGVLNLSAPPIPDTPS